MNTLYSTSMYCWKGRSVEGGGGQGRGAGALPAPGDARDQVEEQALHPFVVRPEDRHHGLRRHGGDPFEPHVVVRHQRDVHVAELELPGEDSLRIGRHVDHVPPLPCVESALGTGAEPGPLEGDAPAPDLPEGDLIRRGAEGSLDRHLGGVVEEAVEPGAAEHADLGAGHRATQTSLCWRPRPTAWRRRSWRSLPPPPPSSRQRRSWTRPSGTTPACRRSG